MANKDGDDFGKFRAEMLRAHNQKRAAHSAGELRLDRELNLVAQDWAQQLAARPSVTLQHRPSNEYGENLFYAWSSSSSSSSSSSTEAPPSVKSIIDSWYAESKRYAYSNREPGLDVASQCGHFTQIIWKESAKLGVGLARKQDSGSGGGCHWFVVANYDPRGNVLRQYAQNVLPPKR